MNKAQTQRTNWMEKEVRKITDEIKYHDSEAIKTITGDNSYLHLIKLADVTVIGKSRVFPRFKERIGTLGPYFNTKEHRFWGEVYDFKVRSDKILEFEITNDFNVIKERIKNHGFYRRRRIKQVENDMGQHLPKGITIKTKFRRLKKNRKLARLIDEYLSVKFPYYESKL